MDFCRDDGCTPIAEEALVAYREYPVPVDLLLSDVILPGRNRVDARKARREDSEFKVLFVTGYAEQLGLCRSEHAECLAKLFSRGALLQKIKQMLDTRQAGAGDYPESSTPSVMRSLQDLGGDFREWHHAAENSQFKAGARHCRKGSQLGQCLLAIGQNVDE